jgi:hypothetical protein
MSPTLDTFGQQAVAQIEKSQQLVGQLVNAKQLVSQIPWGHNLLIVSKSKNQEVVRKAEKDNPTVGMLICKSKKKTVVEYSLKDMNKPIGVSEYQITHALPDELKSSLPTIEEIEAELDQVSHGGHGEHGGGE